MFGPKSLSVLYMYIHCTCTLTTFNSVFMFSNTLIHVHVYTCRVHVHTCTVIKLIQYNIIHLHVYIVVSMNIYMHMYMYIVVSMNIYMHMYIYRMLHNNECLYVHFEQLYMQQSMFILHRRTVLEWFLLHVTIGNIISTSRTILLCGVIWNWTHVHNLHMYTCNFPRDEILMMNIHVLS